MMHREIESNNIIKKPYVIDKNSNNSQVEQQKITYSQHVEKISLLKEIVIDYLNDWDFTQFCNCGSPEWCNCPEDFKEGLIKIFNGSDTK